jgi:hypothetical protein
MRLLDTECVEHRDVVGDPCRQRVRLGLVGRSGASVPAVIGEHQAELVAQRARDARGLRDLDRVEESGVKDDGGARPSPVLEVDRNPVDGVRSERHVQVPLVRMKRTPRELTRIAGADYIQPFG